MDNAITLSSHPDFSGLSLTQSGTGHIHTPFFSFTPNGDAHKDEMLYQRLRYASGRAFASLLNIRDDEMMFSVRYEKDGSAFWSWGTAKPMRLPESLRNKKKADSLAIDV